MTDDEKRNIIVAMLLIAAEDGLAVVEDRYNKIVKWMMNDFTSILNERNIKIDDCPITPERLAGFIYLEDAGIINHSAAKYVLRKMFDTGNSTSYIIYMEDLWIVKSDDEIEKIIDKIIEENSKIVEDIRNGKDKAIGSLMGKVMKESDKKIDPKMANEMLRKKIFNF